MSTPPAGGDVFIGTRLPADLADKLAEEARITERSRAAVVRIAVREYLDAQDDTRVERAA